MSRKRQEGSSIGRLTPSQKYHRKRHRSRYRSSSSENGKSDSESENARFKSRSRSGRFRSRSNRVSKCKTRTESRSRPAFQSVQHVGQQRDARLQKMMQIRPLFTSTLINSEMRPQSER